MNAKKIVILILVALAVIFFLQNTEVVEVRFIFWKLSMSRVLMLTGSLIVGLIIGLFLRGVRAKKG